MKNSFKKFFLAIPSFLLFAYSNGCTMEIENPGAHRDLLVALYTSDPIKAE